MDMLPLAPGFVQCQFPCNFRAVNGTTPRIQQSGDYASSRLCSRPRCAPQHQSKFGATLWLGHPYVAACPAYVTSSVMTLKFARVQGPKEVTIAASVASRPRAIKMRPTRGVLWRASNVYQRPR